MVAASARSGSFEIQFHSANALRRPRSIRLSRRSLRLMAWMVVLWMIGIVAGAVTVPATVRSITERRDVIGLDRTRERLDERVVAIDARYAALGIEAQELYERLLKVGFAFGLDRPEGPAEAPAWTAEEDLAVRPRVVERQALVAGTIDRVEEQLGALMAYEQENPDRVRSTPSISPLPGIDFVLTTAFGFTMSPFTGEAVYHSGIDLAAPVGTSIRSSAAGVVVFAGRYPLSRRNTWWQLGMLVVVRHEREFLTTYGHCDTVLVKSGQQVERGTELATVGASGWASLAQLHYGVWRLGEEGPRPQHPRLFILDRGWSDDHELLLEAAKGSEEGWELLPGAWTR